MTRAAEFAERLLRMFRAEHRIDAPDTPNIDAATAGASLAPRVHYAIGDIHGMNNLLGDLLSLIDADAGGEPKTIVFLGDFVNRGPATKDVFDRLIAGPGDARDRWIVLRGNHEQIMLDALNGADEAPFSRWLQKGGAQTLASYGLGKKDMNLTRARRAVPSEHVRFLDGLPLSHAIAGYLFVHAGIDPHLPLDAQSPETMMTIRLPFQRGAHELPFTVVHGHVPSRYGPVIAPGRIGIDTGACATGVLTAAVIRSGLPPRFLQTTVASGKNAKRQKGR